MDRHEGRGKAFREEPPKQVGKLKGDKEGIGHEPRAQNGGDQDIARNPKPG